MVGRYLISLWFARSSARIWDAGERFSSAANSRRAECSFAFFTQHYRHKLIASKGDDTLIGHQFCSLYAALRPQIAKFKTMCFRSTK